jgi:GntR family transcriptional regulator
MKLNKESPIPLYYQLAERLREQIVTGELPPGAQLPAERELSDQAAISRMTARQAVAYLVRQGVLEVRPGIGTFVAAPKLTYDALHLLGFTEETMRQGGTVQSHVLEQIVLTPSPRVATGLQLTAGQQVVKITRLRLVQAMPLLLETVYLPTALCPGLEDVDLTVQSLYGLLEERYHLHLTRAWQTFESTIANDYEAELFGVPPGSGMILLEGVTFAKDERPVEYFKAIYRGDRFKFAVESQRSDWSNGASAAPRLSIMVNYQ